MGTHGRTGIERYLLGSVTEKTVRTSTVPVSTVASTAERDWLTADYRIRMGQRNNGIRGSGDDSSFSFRYVRPEH